MVAKAVERYKQRARYPHDHLVLILLGYKNRLAIGQFGIDSRLSPENEPALIRISRGEGAKKIVRLVVLELEIERLN